MRLPWVSGEIETSNNCSAGVLVTVGNPPPPDGPDLTVVPYFGDFRFPGSLSTSIEWPQDKYFRTITISTKVLNQGTKDVPLADLPRLRFYKSLDASISTHDTELSSDWLNNAFREGVAAGESGWKLNYPADAPTSSGTHYYGVCVDKVDGESDTSNNCSEALTLTVPEN